MIIIQKAFPDRNLYRCGRDLIKLVANIICLLSSACFITENCSALSGDGDESSDKSSKVSGYKNQNTEQEDNAKLR